MNHPLRRLWTDACDFLLPGACLGCGLACPWEMGLCPLCEASLPRSEQPVQLRPLGAPWAISVATFNYEAGLPELLRRYKFSEDLTAGRCLAKLCLPTLSAAPLPSALVPVPLHRQRLRERGFDQARGIAADWSKALRIPLLDSTLTRERATSAQTRLSAEARRRNLHQAFVAKGSCPAHIALVDDVFTTGSTAWAASEALMAAGAQRVDVWVVARVPAPRAPMTFDQNCVLKPSRTSRGGA